MSGELLARLIALSDAATPGPWYVRQMDDNLCMGAIAIATEPGTHHGHELLVDGAAVGVLAATLIQYPPYIMRDDEREEQNAELIVAMRNALPELIRLAAKGAEREAPTHPGEGRGPVAGR